jgi:hypothetical protein
MKRADEFAAVTPTNKCQDIIKGMIEGGKTTPDCALSMRFISRILPFIAIGSPSISITRSDKYPAAMGLPISELALVSVPVGVHPCPHSVRQTPDERSLISVTISKCEFTLAFSNTIRISSCVAIATSPNVGALPVKNTIAPSASIAAANRTRPCTMTVRYAALDLSSVFTTVFPRDLCKSWNQYRGLSYEHAVEKPERTLPSYWLSIASHHLHGPWLQYLQALVGAASLMEQCVAKTRTVSVPWLSEENVSENSGMMVNINVDANCWNFTC